MLLFGANSYAAQRKQQLGGCRRAALNGILIFASTETICTDSRLKALLTQGNGQSERALCKTAFHHKDSEIFLWLDVLLGAIRCNRAASSMHTPFTVASQLELQIRHECKLFICILARAVFYFTKYLHPQSEKDWPRDNVHRWQCFPKQQLTVCTDIHRHRLNILRYGLQ